MTDLIDTIAMAIDEAAKAPRLSDMDAFEYAVRILEARAALAAIEAEGYRVVPVEPTVGMLAALTKNLCNYPSKKRSLAVGYWAMGSFNEDYAAMLAAAPKVTE